MTRKPKNPWDDTFWQAHPAFTPLPENEERDLKRAILYIIGALVIGFVFGSAYGAWYL